jgi:D-3-phosphoglycerate dehydrogenase
MENKLKGKKVFVTTVAFSGNKYLREKLISTGAIVKFNDTGGRLIPEELLHGLNSSDYAIIGLDKINTSNIANISNNLKAISKYGVGLDNIDIDACEEKNIKILYSKGVNKRSVSELTIGSALMLLRNIYFTSNELKNGNWVKKGGVELSGKKFGIIGLGNIGKDLVSLLKPFGCEIYVNDIEPDQDFINKNNLIFSLKNEIYTNCDIISLHVPLTKKTSNMITKSELSIMKSSGIIINTARGELINLDDLEYFLINKKIGGAALDVYDEEPPTRTELLSLPNLVNTPHIGGNSKEAVIAMGISAINNLINFNKN